MSDVNVLSTGVLTREPLTVSAVVNIVNLDDDDHHVVVEVWDWSSYSNPVQMTVLIGENDPVFFPYQLDSMNLAVMYAYLGETVDLYEIRVSYREDKKIIANCYGRSAPPYASQEGNTVLQKDLVKIKG